MPSKTASNKPKFTAKTKEALAYLARCGLSITEKTLYNWAEAGAPHERAGRQYRWNKPLLLRWTREAGRTGSEGDRGLVTAGIGKRAARQLEQDDEAEATLLDLAQEEAKLKRDLQAAKLQAVRMKNAEASASVVSVERYHEALASIQRIVLAHLERMPRRLRSPLARARSSQAVERILKEDVARLRAELADPQTWRTVA